MRSSWQVASRSSSLRTHWRCEREVMSRDTSESPSRMLHTPSGERSSHRAHKRPAGVPGSTWHFTGCSKAAPPTTRMISPRGQHCSFGLCAGAWHAVDVDLPFCVVGAGVCGLAAGGFCARCHLRRRAHLTVRTTKPLYPRAPRAATIPGALLWAAGVAAPLYAAAIVTVSPSLLSWSRKKGNERKAAMASPSHLCWWKCLSSRRTSP
jgi:hypothetical protein